MIHIYGQAFEHQPAYIVGDLASLTALRDAIDQAVAAQSSCKVQAMTNDGEGYTLYVKIWHDDPTLRRPYTEPPSRDERDDDTGVLDAWELP